MNNYPGKRWAIGDDSVIEQVTFHCINWHMTSEIIHLFTKRLTFMQ
jgi:hypothetical protein